jgi:hypothetical protein
MLLRTLLNGFVRKVHCAVVGAACRVILTNARDSSRARYILLTME